MKEIARTIAAVGFGLILPILVLYQAYSELHAVGRSYFSQRVDVDPVQVVTGIQAVSRDANDYALYSMLFLERSNKEMMLTKQVMKWVIIQIGFAVMSVGMMFLILGLEERRDVNGTDASPGDAGEGGGEFAGIKVNFRIGSTGTMIFLAGALMSTGGAVIPNSYATASMPNYVWAKGGGITYWPSVYDNCKDDFGDAGVDKCFLDAFKKTLVTRGQKNENP